jgi:hypothetical protein
MTTHILTGSKQEIADSIARIGGEVRKAIVFVEDADPLRPETERPSKDIFAEMAPYMVDAIGVDDSRAAIYSRMDAE